MKIHFRILLLAIAAAFITQPCFAQLRSVLQKDVRPVERVARLDDQPIANSYGFQADRMVANRPSAAPSVLAYSDGQTASNSQPKSAKQQLQIQIDGPGQITAGTAYSFFATIENPSNTAIDGVQVSLAPNSGLRPALNSFPVLFLARLEPRFKARFEFKLIADEPGQVDLGFAAIGRIDEQANTEIQSQTESNHWSGYAAHQVQVARPMATTQLTGPSMMYIGTDANYAIKVTNLADEPMPNVIVSLDVPDGLEITILDRQADVDAQQGQVLWHVPLIETNRSEIIQFRARAIDGGQQVAQVGVVVAGQTMNTATLATTVVDRVKARTTSNSNGVYSGR